MRARHGHERHSITTTTAQQQQLAINVLSLNEKIVSQWTHLIIENNSTKDNRSTSDCCRYKQTNKQTNKRAQSQTRMRHCQG